MLRLGHDLRLVLVLIGILSVVGIGGRRGLHELVVHVVLGCLGVLLILQIGDDLHRGEHQHTQQQHQNQVIQDFPVLSASSVMGSAGIGGRHFPL